MKKSKTEETVIEVLWVKLVSYSIFTLVLVFLLIFVPKQVFEDNMAYTMASSMAIPDSSNLLLYDYDVYATEARFTEGLIVDVNTVKAEFMERSEILAVMICGDEYKVEYKEDYLFIVNPDTPELNIEYYLAKDLSVNNMNVSCRTFIMLFEDISTLVNTVYIGVLTLFFGLTFIPFVVKLTRLIIGLKMKNKSQIEEIIKD
ncbi:MAG: hypothetical protein AB7U79_02360 [Candidatus Izemoplasmatales bacterium]